MSSRTLASSRSDKFFSFSHKRLDRIYLRTSPSLQRSCSVCVFVSVCVVVHTFLPLTRRKSLASTLHRKTFASSLFSHTNQNIFFSHCVSAHACLPSASTIPGTVAQPHRCLTVASHSANSMSTSTLLFYRKVTETNTNVYLYSSPIARPRSSPREAESIGTRTKNKRTKQTDIAVRPSHLAKFKGIL